MTFETFRPISDYVVRNLTSSAPAAFNGFVHIRRYRVTVELIEESQEVLGERLEKLWVESDNYHDLEPLEIAASEIGYVFKGRFRERNSGY